MDDNGVTSENEEDLEIDKWGAIPSLLETTLKQKKHMDAY